MTDKSCLAPIDGFRRDSGHCWTVELPEHIPPGDGDGQPSASRLRVFENGLEIGPAHALHDAIRTVGRGAFSHWGRTLYLSASDNRPLKGDRRSRHVLWEAAPEPGLRQTVKEIIDAWPEPNNAEQRYALLEATQKALSPEYPLSEFGREVYHDQDFLNDYRFFEPSNSRSVDRKLVLRAFITTISPVPGEIAECGVYKGHSAFVMAKTMKRLGIERPIHLFDSFAGLSPPGGEDGEYWYEGALAFNLEAVQDNLSAYDNIHYWPGWIPSRFDEVSERRFAFVHLDVDLYQPTLDALEFFYGRMSSGGILICDDYGFSTCPGARKALDQFFSQREPVLDLPTGQGLVIKR